MQYKRNKNKNNISKYIIFLNKIFYFTELPYLEQIYFTIVCKI